MTRGYHGVPPGYRSLGRGHGGAVAAREEIRRALLSSIGADIHTGATGAFPEQFSQTWANACARNLNWADRETDRILSQASLWYLSPSGQPLSFYPPPGWDQHASYVLGAVSTVGRQSEFDGASLMIAESDLAAILKTIAGRQPTGPSDQAIIEKFSEMKARGMKRDDILSGIKNEPGFAGVGYASAKALYAGLYRRGRPSKLGAA